VNAEHFRLAARPLQPFSEVACAAVAAEVEVLNLGFDFGDFSVDSADAFFQQLLAWGSCNLVADQEDCVVGSLADFAYIEL